MKFLKRNFLFALMLSLILSCTACQSEAPSAQSDTPALSPTLTETVIQTPEPTPVPTPAPTPEPPPPPAPSDILIDLSDGATYRKLNLFFSNFSESRFPSFSVDDPDYGVLADFAFSHACINNPSAVEDCLLYVDGELFATERLSAANVKKSVQRFFGDIIDLTEIEVACENGRGCGMITNGAYGVAFTLVDAISDLGENRFEAQFHIYAVPNADYPCYDASSGSAIYSAQPNELPLSPLGESFVAFPGSATFEAYQNENGIWNFWLRTYTVEYE